MVVAIDLSLSKRVRTIRLSMLILCIVNLFVIELSLYNAICQCVVVAINLAIVSYCVNLNQTKLSRQHIRLPTWLLTLAGISNLLVSIALSYLSIRMWIGDWPLTEYSEEWVWYFNQQKIVCYISFMSSISVAFFLFLFSSRVTD